MCTNPPKKGRKCVSDERVVSFAAIDFWVMPGPTYISCGLNLWMRAQRAIPLFHEDVKSVTATFL